VKWVIEIEGGAALPANMASACRVAASKFPAGLDSTLLRLADAAQAATEAPEPAPKPVPDPDRTSVPVMMENADFDRAVAASINRLRVWNDDAGYVSAHER
jgi:hypothetical protein